MKLQKLRINYQQMISYTGFFILNLWYNLRMYTIKNNGIHKQTISLNKTATPHELKNELIEIGDTGIG